MNLKDMINKIFIFILLNITSIISSNLPIMAEELKQNKELDILENLMAKGAFNSDIFKRASELSPSPEKSLAYALQAESISPTSENRKLLNSIRKEFGRVNELPDKEKLLSISKNKYLITSYLPRHVIDYIIIIGSILLIILTLLRLYKNKFKISSTLLFILLLCLCIQRFIIYQSPFGEIILTSPLSSRTYDHAVIMNRIKGFAGPDKNLQETLILTPGEEVLVLDSSNNGSWKYVKTIRNRKAWINVSTDSIFIIK